MQSIMALNNYHFYGSKIRGKVSDDVKQSESLEILFKNKKLGMFKMPL